MRAILFAALTLAACASTTGGPGAQTPLPEHIRMDLEQREAALHEQGVVIAAINQTADLGNGLRVRPLEVLEDSRCPMEARCIRAGDVRLQVRIRLGRGSELREVKLGQSVQVADGQLTLQGVMPPRSVQRAIRPGDYRFSFTFAGGL